MDVVFRLREANQKLIKLENTLDTERDALINHEANDMNTLTSNAVHFNYMSMVERYTGFADDYNKELVIFKDLLKESVDQQSSVLNANNNSVHLNNNNEITSNYLPTSVNSFHSLSSPVIDKVSTSNDNISYINDDSNVSTNSSQPQREIASSNMNTQQYEEPVANEKVLALPKIQPKAQVVNDGSNYENKYDDNVAPAPITRIARRKPAIRVKVANKLAYKYEGLGFDIWKKNGRRAIYTMTELYCYKTVSSDEAGKLKLKRFLIKNGFKSNVIEKVSVIKEKESGFVYGLIQVRDSQDNIQNVMDKMNNGKDEHVIEINHKRQYSSRREQNRKLFVKNFDIVNKKDHKRMTEMFLRFGDLDCDIFMNRDRNGNPYCFVTFRDIQDAIACEKNQNWNRDPLWFNGRELSIQYIDDSKKGNNGKKKNGKSGKKYYNSRR
mmetsp:Transcript_13496/g.12091  ORF Transcript_13496/g.12091 Transcript_13496/m.12091 type:complete len:439 (+) Transcript_13496:346-1662(+)